MAPMSYLILLVVVVVVLSVLISKNMFLNLPTPNGGESLKKEGSFLLPWFKFN